MYQDGPSHLISPHPIIIRPSLPPATSYLECQPSLHFICQNLRDTAIEVRQDLHRQLRLHATVADQVVEGIRKSQADAT
jgi:hypothetical protein